jgi:archaellum biogenesis ATPase FlaH/5S rRNA maturation endonuclease (ribonuclease M5)
MFGEDGEPLVPQKYTVGQKKTYETPSTALYPLTDEIISYFDSRKISRETLEVFNVSSDKDGNIVFPFYRNGNMVYVKIRRPRKPLKGESKEWQERNTEPILFGMDGTAFDQQLVISEGMVDALTLYEAGIHNVVSVPGGTENMEWVNLCWDWLEKFDDILLFGDADEPGQAMVKRLVKMLGEARCSVVEDFPVRPGTDNVPCKDPNEIMYFYGAEKLREVVRGAKKVRIKGIIQLCEIKRVDYTTVPRVLSKIPKYDELIGGFFDGTLTVISGASGAGKSTLNGTILLNAIEQGRKVFAYSGELPAPKFLDWILFQAAGGDYITLKYDKYRAKDVPYVPTDVERAIVDWTVDKFYVADNSEIMVGEECDGILYLCEQAARRYGCHVFLIDNAMTAIGASDDKLSAQIKLANSLKQFAMRFDAVVILVAHPRKLPTGQARMTADDISGASEFRNLADSVFSVEKPDIRLLKNRDGGLNVLIECAYCPDSRRIYQLDAGDTYEYGWDKSVVQKPAILARSKPEYQPRIRLQEPI